MFTTYSYFGILCLLNAALFPLSMMAASTHQFKIQLPIFSCKIASRSWITYLMWQELFLFCFTYFQWTVSSSQGCKLSADLFSYVWKYYISPKQAKHQTVIGTKLHNAYEAYSGMPIDDDNKSYTPHMYSGRCQLALERWLWGTRKFKSFAVPQIWEELTSQHDHY